MNTRLQQLPRPRPHVNISSCADPDPDRKRRDFRIRIEVFPSQPADEEDLQEDGYDHAV
jgi:hypothetical protein